MTVRTTSCETPTELHARARRREAGDVGFTTVEILISVLLTGILLTVLSTALVAALETTPSAEDRIDDARSTRTLSTWLAQDTTSTPPFLPEQAQGGFEISTGATADNNDCGGTGTNVVHMQWTETTSVTVRYVANYRFVVDGDSARIRRLACNSENGDPFETTFDRPVTPNLDPAQVPTANVITDSLTGEVLVVSFELVGRTGETVLIETSSRNPSEFYP